MLKWRIFKSKQGQDSVDVSEKDGIRYLHLGHETVQSAMRVREPFTLALTYTQAMMGFMLFNPDPRRMLMVGLGGGSMAKWVHKHLPLVHNTVVEINPEVIAASRAYFHLPDNDDRLNVQLGDGARAVWQHKGEMDVCFVDAYDSKAIVDELATEEFFDGCLHSLKEDGILSVNLWGSDKRFNEYRSRIERVFAGRVLCLPAEHHSNIIVFGFARSPGSPRWGELQARAIELEALYKLPFTRFVDSLKTLNPHTDKRLLLE